MFVLAIVVIFALSGETAQAGGGGGPTATPTTTPTTTSIGPRITSVTPMVAQPGDLVIIRGENFLPWGVDVSMLQVWLAHDDGGVAVLASVSPYTGNVGWEDNAISFLIGTDRPNQSGYLSVLVGNRNTRWTERFTIWTGSTPTPTVTPTPIPTQIPPVITRVIPTAAAPGQQVVVEGQNFRAASDLSLYVWLEYQEGSAIELTHFNPEYNNQNWTNGVLTFTVSLLESRSGLVRVDARSRSGYSPEIFTILSVSSTLTPTPTIAPIPFPPTYLNVPLGNGWNLVSIPSDASAYTASSLVAEMFRQGIVVAQVASWENGGWHSYLPGLPTDGFAILSGRGYFVRVTTSGTWHPGYRE